MKKIFSVLILTFIGTSAFAERETAIVERTRVLKEVVLAVGDCRAEDGPYGFNTSFRVLKNVTSQKYLVKVVIDVDRRGQSRTVSEEMYTPTLITVTEQVLSGQGAVRDKDYERALQGCRADLATFKRFNLQKDFQ